MPGSTEMLKGRWVNQGLENSPFGVQSFPTGPLCAMLEVQGCVSGKTLIDPRAGWPLGPEEIRTGLQERGRDRYSIKNH